LLLSLQITQSLFVIFFHLAQALDAVGNGLDKSRISDHAFAYPTNLSSNIGNLIELQQQRRRLSVLDSILSFSSLIYGICQPCNK